MRRNSVLIFSLVAATCITAAAQTKPVNSEQARAANDKAAAAMEAERVLKERRANARSLLVSLATDARNFSDATLRARTQARIADMLWDSDHERSKSMFRSAWDAAEAADAESQARVQEDIRQQQAGTGSSGYVIATPPEVRREVLGFAARRDRKLGEELLAKYRDEKTNEGSRRPGSTNEDSARRFAVAEELLAAGDVQQALQFAEPALGSVVMQSVDFLASLREKDAALADQHYAAMLQSAAVNPQSDANTVALLAAYIFSPHLYVTFRANGGPSSAQTGPVNAANVSAQLRAAFFRSAAAILLRPMSDQSTVGADGQYLAIKRMLPLFEQFGPAETAAALRAHLDNLAAVASSGALNRDDDWMHRGIEPDKRRNDEKSNGQPSDREQSLLDRAERARTSAERDQIYLELALVTIDKDDRRARDYVDKIEDMDLRNSVRSYVDASIAYKAVRKRDVERALELAQKGDLTHLQRSWLLSQTAALIAATDREKSAQVIEDAAAEARRIETGDADRPRAFFAIANVVRRTNRANAWAVIDDAIRAANSAEKFTGEDGELTFKLAGKSTRAVSQYPFPDFNVTGIFGELANEDYDKAVELARGFQRDAPRANAVIAVAKSVLDEKKK
ncbi:MAG TPA: hypothetical protein VHQ64_04095 [Pyrinomonadaceae bacterium]|nr:hypothetical protein [Pyrinomonadaceae bacterium]